MNQIMDALLAEAEFSGAQVRMAPLNIEEQFCRLMSLVGSQEASQTEWPEYTEMRALSGRATMAEKILRIESFEAGVSELTLGVSGQLNLNDEQYDFTLPMRLRRDTTRTHGRHIQYNFLV